MSDIAVMFPEDGLGILYDEWRKVGAQQERERLEPLLKWVRIRARHLGGCAFWRYPKEDCNCGFDQVRALADPEDDR